MKGICMAIIAKDIAEMVGVSRQAVSAVLSCVYMFSRYDIMKTSRQDYYFDAAAVGKMLSLLPFLSKNNEESSMSS